jgi:GNAT superfamily N-acetyltransferase
MSLYGQYIAERLGDKIVEDERGFATYRFLDSPSAPGKGAVYIVDLYVRPEFRKTRLASAMADEICKEALRVGCVEMLGTVAPSAKNATDSIKILLAYGMTILSASPDLIIFRKEL